MANLKDTLVNRVLVVDDDAALIAEYLRCLEEDIDPAWGTSTLYDLEKALFGQEQAEKGAARFNVQTQNQGEAAVEAVKAAE